MNEPKNLRIFRTLSLYAALRDLVLQMDMMPIPYPPNVKQALTMARVALREERELLDGNETG